MQEEIQAMFNITKPVDSHSFDNITMWKSVWTILGDQAIDYGTDL